MLLSIYTFAKNAIFYDYHIVEMLRHHLPLADEIIVNEGYSTDDTYEQISRIDPKVKIYRSHWGKPRDKEWFVGFKDDARKKCRGEWCILLDCDEFIPEWEFAAIRALLASSNDMLAPMRLLNFYGNYRVYHARPDKVTWPEKKMVIHRNHPDIRVWGDGSNVRLENHPGEVPVAGREFTCHHFGFVRHAARLRQKWRNIFGNLYSSKRKWLRLPSLLFDWKPHNWFDPQYVDDLAVYPGPYIEPVRRNPDEFVRDNFRLYNHLQGRAPHDAVLDTVPHAAGK